MERGNVNVKKETEEGEERSYLSKFLGKKSKGIVDESTLSRLPFKDCLTMEILLLMEEVESLFDLDREILLAEEVESGLEGDCCLDCFEKEKKFISSSSTPWG